jgi:hypothetical protein
MKLLLLLRSTNYVLGLVVAESSIVQYLYEHIMVVWFGAPRRPTESPRIYDIVIVCALRTTNLLLLLLLLLSFNFLLMICILDLMHGAGQTDTSTVE